MADGKPTSGVGTVMKFFGKKPGQSLAEFKHDEWDKLTDKDKEQLRDGVNDGTFDYQV